MINYSYISSCDLNLDIWLHENNENTFHNDCIVFKVIFLKQPQTRLLVDAKNILDVFRIFLLMFRRY